MFRLIVKSVFVAEDILIQCYTHVHTWWMAFTFFLNGKSLFSPLLSFLPFIAPLKNVAYTFRDAVLRATLVLSIKRIKTKKYLKNHD